MGVLLRPPWHVFRFRACGVWCLPIAHGLRSLASIFCFRPLLFTTKGRRVWTLWNQWMGEVDTGRWQPCWFVVCDLMIQRWLADVGEVKDLESDQEMCERESWNDATYTRIGNRIHWLFRRQFRFAVQMTWPVTQRHVLIESLNRGFFCENRFAHERPKWDGTNPLGWVNTCSWHVGCDVRTCSFIFVRNVLHFIHTFSVSRLQLGPRISPHKCYAWWECYAVNQESFGLLTLNWSWQSWRNFSRFVFHLAHGSHQ